MGWCLSQVIHPSWTLLVLSRWKRVFLEPEAAALWLRTWIREDEPKIQKQVRLDVLNLTSAKCFICPNETTESFIANWVTQMVSPAGFDTPPGCEWSWCPECPEWPESTECPEGPWPCASWASMSAIFDRKKASSLCGSVSHECSAFCWPPWHSQNCWLFHQKWVKGSEVHKEPWEGFAVFLAEHIVICLTLNDKYMFQDGINKSVCKCNQLPAADIRLLVESPSAIEAKGCRRTKRCHCTYHQGEFMGIYFTNTCPKELWQNTWIS